MNKKYALIIFTEHLITANGQRWVTCEWRGEKHWETIMSIKSLVEDGYLPSVSVEIGQIFSIGPFPLQVIDIVLMQDEIVCVRTDANFGITAFLYSIWQWIYPFAMGIWQRLLATGEIWELMSEQDKGGDHE